ncbi:hypothetical protein [Xanthomonas sacchari]|uniref:Lipoprotein n=1 Tax=Xanthomonas sacchari TaxID=56458 RepID=A0AA46SY56_9XANT|nr:hypothetical protein [Xanthomonas sacchari]UYK90638.1 hypothetical protein NG824_09750 [Xanthomonas sacchari]
MKFLKFPFFLILLVCVGLVGCSNKQEMRWKEQVWLSNGQRIDVDRYSVALKSGFPNSNDGPPIYQEISYLPLGVHWSAKSGEKGVPEMLSFEIIDGDAYLVVVMSGDLKLFCVGKPAGTYLFNVYRWRKGTVQEIDQSEAPIARMGVNLSGTGNWGLRHADKPVTYLSWKDVAFATKQPSEGPPELISEFYNAHDRAVCK